MIETGPVPRSPQAQSTRRALALAVGVLALAGLVSGLFAHKVLVDEGVEGAMGCGLRVCDSTYGNATTSSSIIGLLEDMKRAGTDVPMVWGYAGLIGWIAGILAIVGVAISVAMVGAKKYVRLPVMSPTTIALLFGAIALVCGCVFAATKPMGIGVTSIGWTFWSFCGGSVLAVISAFLLSRQLALLEPEFDPGESPELPPDEPWQEP